MAEFQRFRLRQTSFWNKEFNTMPKKYDQCSIEMIILLETERITQITA